MAVFCIWFFLNPELSICRSGSVLEKACVHTCVYQCVHDAHTQLDRRNKKETKTKTEWEREVDTLEDGRKIFVWAFKWPLNNSDLDSFIANSSLSVPFYSFILIFCTFNMTLFQRTMSIFFV